MKELKIFVDGLEAWREDGRLVPDRVQGADRAWVFWPEAVAYTRDLSETLSTIASERYGASAYALDAQHGRAVIITPLAEARGVDTDLDLAGYTVVAI